MACLSVCTEVSCALHFEAATDDIVCGVLPCCCTAAAGVSDVCPSASLLRTAPSPCNLLVGGQQFRGCRHCHYGSTAIAAILARISASFAAFALAFECGGVISRAHVSRNSEQQTTASCIRMTLMVCFVRRTTHQCPRADEQQAGVI